MNTILKIDKEMKDLKHDINREIKGINEVREKVKGKKSKIIKENNMKNENDDIEIKYENTNIKFEDIVIKSEDIYIKSEDIQLKSEDEDLEVVKAQNCAVQEKEDMDCGQSFSYTKCDENLHFKNRFPCKVCPKSYSLKNNLSEHMRTHTGDKSTNCSLCDKIFSQKLESNCHNKLLLECQDKKFSNKGSREGWLLLPKHSQNFIFQQSQCPSQVLKITQSSP